MRPHFTPPCAFVTGGSCGIVAITEGLAAAGLGVIIVGYTASKYAVEGFSHALRREPMP